MDNKEVEDFMNIKEEVPIIEEPLDTEFEDDELNVPDDIDETEDIIPESEIYPSELDELKKTLSDLSQHPTNSNFSRTENKFDFASEIINANENQKTANLDLIQIDDLIAKRRFFNICKAFNWDVLAGIIGKVVTDIEGYSLSNDGLLVKLITTDLQRSLSISEQRVSKRKKVKGGNDDGVVY